MLAPATYGAVPPGAVERADGSGRLLARRVSRAPGRPRDARKLRGDYDPASPEVAHVGRWFALVAFLFVPLSAAAQCTVTQVTFTSYGSGCNAVFPQQVPALSGAWNAPSCTVTLT